MVKGWVGLWRQVPMRSKRGGGDIYLSHSFHFPEHTIFLLILIYNRIGTLIDVS